MPIGTAYDPAMEEYCSSWAQLVNAHRERIAFLQGTPVHTSPDCPPRGPHTGHTGSPCSPATRFVPFSLDGLPEGPAPTGCPTTSPTRSSQPAVAPPLSAQHLSSDALAPTGCPGEPPASSSDLQHNLLLAMFFGTTSFAPRTYCPACSANRLSTSGDTSRSPKHGSMPPITMP